MKNFSKNAHFIKNLFNSISTNYDKLNDIMSFGLHRRIKNQVINKIPFNIHYSPSTILDLCCGTGDITALLKENFSKATVTGIDFSPEMLKVASKKHSSINFLKADCNNLPFEDSTFDICTISFGLRNVEDIEKVLKEIYRVLKPDGIFINLDLGKPNKFFNLFLKPYMYIWVAILGKIFHGDETPYKYLAESNETFPSPKELLNIYGKTGFSNCTNQNFLFGQIAAQYCNKK